MLAYKIFLYKCIASFKICLHTSVHTPSSENLLVIAIKYEGKETYT